MTMEFIIISDYLRLSPMSPMSSQKCLARYNWENIDQLRKLMLNLRIGVFGIEGTLYDPHIIWYTMRVDRRDIFLPNIQSNSGAKTSIFGPQDHRFLDFY